MKKFVVSLLGVAVAFTGCSNSSHKQPASAAVTIACPTDVEAQVVAEHSCAMVEVADGVTLFTLEVEPSTPSDLAPVVVVGDDLGEAPDYGGLAPIAERTGRATYIVDLRGVGHSTPSLDCPEVAGLKPAVANDPSGTLPAVVAAVATCRHRLRAANVDVTDFDLAHNATDLHEFVHSLGISHAVALSTGTTGTVSLAWAGEHPEDLGALVLDSPIFTHPPLRERSDQLVAAAAAACSAEPDCAKKYGDLDALWQMALNRLSTSELHVITNGATVTVDDAALRRAVLWIADVGDTAPELIPALVRQAAAGNGDGEQLVSFADFLANSAPYCTGYLPKCHPAFPLSFGAALSLNCPVLHDDAVWHHLCSAWAVTDPSPFVGPVTTPTLVLTGAYDGMETPKAVHDAIAAAVPDAHFIDLPLYGHNVLGKDCAREIRSAWLAGDLGQPPPHLACLDDTNVSFR